MGTVINLPKIPKDHNYEDFIAAHLNAEGFFLERSIRKREDEEILELDIVTNKFETDHVEKTFIEAKSGHKWGFPDIFKVKGWMVYLEYPTAYFIVLDDTEKNMSFYQRVSNVLGIYLLSTPVVGDGVDDHELYETFSISKRKYNKMLVPLFRYAYVLERIMLSHLAEELRKKKDSHGLLNLKYLITTVNDSSFFTRNPKHRVAKIIDAFKCTARLTAKICSERQGTKYEEIPEDVIIDTEIFKKLYHTCTEKDILYTSLYAELIEKLEILKCCVEEAQRPKEASLFAQLEDGLLPENIRKGTEKLKLYSHFYLYPYLMQVFIYVFGGFILIEKEWEEYELLSEITGVPLDEVQDALRVFDILFPKEDGGSWIIPVPYSDIIQLDLMPIPFCGIGANLRRFLYCKKTGKYEDLKPQVSSYTYKDLNKWNDLLVIYLETSNDVEKSEKK